MVSMPWLNFAEGVGGHGRTLPRLLADEIDDLEAIYLRGCSSVRRSGVVKSLKLTRSLKAIA
jgi:hypothetical protein